MNDEEQKNETAAGSACGEDEKKEPDLEESIRALEGIVSKLESGDLSLEEALAEFERGVGIVKEANGILNEAEKRIKVLTEDGDLDEL